VDFGNTRQENDTNLLTRIDAIKTGQDLSVLEPFARAYLGLFYDIDNQLPAEQRIELLANADLAHAVKQGLMAVLYRDDLPTPDSIAQSMLKQETQTVGYAVLAGMSLLTDKQADVVDDLPALALKSSICFHHAISTFHDDNWYLPLITRKPALAAQALLSMWRELLQNKQDFLPGLRPILKDESLIPLFREVAIPLLIDWPHCRKWDLYRILARAIQYVDASPLRDAAQAILSDDRHVSMANQVYWHATAFLLAPEEHVQNMINFMGQEKIKLLPLLDFVIPLLQGHYGQAFNLSAMGYAGLIRCLAQKFTPQIALSDSLSDVTAKVMWLFYKLACFSREEGEGALKSLRRVRVLKLYSDIFDSIAVLQQQTDKPDYAAFLQMLRDEGRLREKKNWHDAH